MQSDFQFKYLVFAGILTVLSLLAFKSYKNEKNQLKHNSDIGYSTTADSIHKKISENDIASASGKQK